MVEKFKHLILIRDECTLNFAQKKAIDNALTLLEISEADPHKVVMEETKKTICLFI